MFVCICVATTTTLNCCDMLRVGGPDDIFYLLNRFVFAAFTCDQRFIYDGVLLGLQQPIPNPHVMFTMWSVFIYFGNSRKYHAFAWIVSFAWSIMGVLIPQFFIPNLYKQIYKSAGKKYYFPLFSITLCGCAAVCVGDDQIQLFGFAASSADIAGFVLTSNAVSMGSRYVHTHRTRIMI